jgi:hypothetical protein
MIEIAATSSSCGKTTLNNKSTERAWASRVATWEASRLFPYGKKTLVFTAFPLALTRAPWRLMMKKKGWRGSRS